MKTFHQNLVAELDQASRKRERRIWPEAESMRLDGGRRGILQRALLVALGIDQTGAKTILGFHQEATENQQIWDQLFDELVSRGLNLKQNFMAVVDGGRAMRASIKKHCGERVVVQRCQLHYPDLRIMPTRIANITPVAALALARSA